MSQTDERVVSIEFDNRNFEKNTQQTINTLNDLDESLQKAGSAKGLENLGKSANKIDLSGLADNVQTVADRFSTMGIVGMTAIQNITNGVMNLGKKALGQIISGGWKRALNIEQAKFQIEGLKGVWDDTSKGYKEGMKTIKDAVNNAVSGTAYGLDEAAKVGSQLMASGITNTNTLEEHLKSVSGLAAMTGGSFEDIGRIFTQVAGQGRVLGDQLNQVSARGINAAATMKNYLNNNKSIRDEVLKTAKASGKSANLVAGMIENVNKGMDLTEGNVRDLVSTGTVSFEVFSGAMHEAFAEHAKEANKTFTGSLANMKAALSRIGAEFATPSLENLRDIFNSLTPLIDSVHVAMMPFVEFTADGMNKATKATTTFMKSLIVLNDEGKFKAWASVETVAKKLTKVLGGQDSKNIADIWGGLLSLFNILKRAISSVFKTFGSGAHSIGSFLLSIGGLLGRLIMSVDDATKKTTLLGSVIKLLRSILTGIIDVLGSIFDLTSKFITGLDWRNNGVTKLTDSMEKSAGVLDKVRKLIKNVFDGISDSISNGLSSISKSTSEGNTKGLMSLFQVGIFTSIGIAITRLINVISKFGKHLDKNVNGFLKKAKSLLTDLGGILSQYQKLIKAKMIREIAISIGILAAALFLIAQVDSDRVTSSLASMGALFVEFIIAFSVLTKKINSTSAKDVAKLNLLSTALIGFSVSVAILSLAVSKLGHLSWEEIAKGLTAVTVLLYSISKFAERMNTVSDGMFKTSSALIVLGIALNILAQAVKTLGDMKPDALLKGLIGIFGMLTALQEFMTNAKNLDMSIKTAAGLLVMSMALAVLSSAVSKLGALDLNQMATALFGIGTLLLEIQMFSSAMSDMKNLYSSSNALFMIAGSISIMAEGLKKLGTLSWENITKGLVTFTATLLIADVALNKLSSLGSMGSGMALIMLATALNIFVPALKKLGSLPIQTIGQALLYLAGVLITFGVVAKILSAFAGSMIVVAAALGLFGAGMALAGAGMLAFATGLTMLAASGTAILSSIPAFVTGLVQGLKQFIIEVATMIPNLVELGMQIIIALLQGIRDNIPLMVEIAADIIIKLLDALTEKIPAIVDAGFKFIGAFIEGIVKGLSEFSNVVKNGAKILSAETIHMLAEALLELAAAAFILSKVSIVGAIKGGIAFIAFVNILAVLFAELGALNKIPGIKEFINGGAELLASIGHGIGKFVGSIIGGFGEGMTNSMPQMAENLSTFMKKLQPFLNGAKNINPDIGSGIKSVAAAILYLTGAKLLDALSVFAGSNTFSEFGEQLNQFAPGFKKFANSMKDVDEEAISKVKSVGAVIKTLAQTASEIPNTGGLVSVFTGDNNLSDFTKQFAKVSVDLNTMVMGLSAIPKGGLTKIKNAGEAIKGMVELANDIPNTGGLVSIFTGDNTLSAFAEELASFGEPLATFADSVSGVKSWEGVKNAGEAMKSINEFANNIPNSGGLLADIVGDNNLSDFGEQLAGFVPSLTEFVNSAASVKTDNVEKVKGLVPIMKAMTEVINAMPNTGGLVQDFTGSSILTNEEFGPNIKKFGKAIAATAEAFAGIKDTSSIEAAIPLIAAFRRLIANLPETGGIFSIFTGDEDLETWSTQLKSFGKGLKEFMTEITGVTFTNIEGLPGLITALSKVGASSENFDAENFDKIIAVIGGEDGTSKFGKALKTFCNQISTIKTDNVNAISTLITSLAKAAKKSDGVSFDSLITLSASLPKLGKNLGKFSTNLGKFNGDSAKEAAGVVKTLSSITDSFTQFTTTTRRGNSVSASFDTKTFDSFTSALGDIAKEIKTFAEDMQKVKTDGLTEKAEEIKTFINSVVSSVNKASKSLKKKGKQGINAFLQGFTNVGSAKVDSSKISNVVIKSLGSPNFAQYNKAGISAAAKYVSGLTKELSKAKNAGKDIFDKVKAGANQSLTQTGQNVGQGFVNGIKNKSQAAYNAGAELYRQAKQAIKDKSDQSSPSKDAMKLGGFVGEGFVIGLKKYNREAYKAGEEVTGSMLTGMNDNLYSEFGDPVIKPVVDLSNVKAGADQIGGMFGTTSINPNLVPVMQNRQNRASETEMFKEAVDKMSNTIVQSQQTNNAPTYNIGDVTLKVDDLKDVLTLDQFVAVVKKAKSFS